MRYEIQERIFSDFPGYCRAVVVARDVDNGGEAPELVGLLRDLENSVRNDTGMENYREHPHIAAWRDTFLSMGLNPNKYPPSIANLIKRTRSGKDLPFISKLVTIFNVISLKYITPCGGDDLDVLEGAIRLGYAEGNETYIPLGQPEKTENPTPGEIIYFDTGNLDVFCRGWCWKNGDRSKITPLTRNVAINIEGMPPLDNEQTGAMADELADMVRKYCGGSTAIYLLTGRDPFFEIDI
ncbi:MAG TPA: phenylalanine--tRNA ligase beta subunit-related protein [Synergistales bacterium]|nr:phenylalanine--tRNA ligase beta subunit-related protein [Synergistales bacterium]